MATVSVHTDDDHDLALAKESKWMSSIASTDELSFKSDSEMEMDLRAKETEIDRQISHAEKVPKGFCGSIWDTQAPKNVNFVGYM